MLSKLSWTVGEPRSPSLSSFLPTLKPGRSGVTMKAPIPRPPRRAPAVSVRAIVRIAPAVLPLVTQDFVPLRTQDFAIPHGLSRQCRCIRSGVGLGQSKGAQYLTARHRFEKPILLCVVAEAKDHLRRKRVVHAHEDGDRRIGRGDLFQRDQVRAGISAQPIVLLGQHHAEESELAQLLHERRLEVALSRSHSAAYGAISAQRELARELLNLAFVLR